MKKDNPKCRWHLTTKERETIKKLTLRGIPQATIARLLKLGAPTVSRAQRAMGLPTRLIVPEVKIMELFRAGWGGYKIAKHLHVAVSAVYKVAHKNNFHRADNVGYATPPENEARLIEAIKNREDYSKRLAKKYGVGICKAQRLAREVLATPRFRPGASKPPLSSNFPQKHYDAKLGVADHFVQLVQHVCEKCFGGRLPRTDDTTFVYAMMCAFGPVILEGQPQSVLESFGGGLAQAIDCLRREREARWQN